LRRGGAEGFCARHEGIVGRIKVGANFKVELKEKKNRVDLHHEIGIVNRGGKIAVNGFNIGASAAVQRDSPPGDGFLFAHGFAVLSIGWQRDTCPILTREGPARWFIRMFSAYFLADGDVDQLVKHLMIFLALLYTCIITAQTLFEIPIAEAQAYHGDCVIQSSLPCASPLIFARRKQVSLKAPS
jgi:hypothetical protein